jgi:hypothetical protein
MAADWERQRCEALTRANEFQGCGSVMPDSLYFANHFERSVLGTTMLSACARQSFVARTMYPRFADAVTKVTAIITALPARAEKVVDFGILNT